MKQLLLKTILLCFAIICTNCSDDNEQPTDENSFSCLINGDLYIPEGGRAIGGGDIEPYTWSYNENDNTFTIITRGDFRIRITSTNSILEKNYLNQRLNDTFDSSNSGMIVKNETIFYNTKNNQNNGTITFTELSETKSVGTFECTLYNENGDKIKITKGKFNLTK